jgi:LPXTG-motif cell wall-anchored protein
LLDETWIEQDRKTRVGNGTVRFNYLNDGKYRVREVNIPTGYTLITPNDVEVSIYELESKNVEFRNQLDFTPPPPPPEDEPRIPEIPDRPDRPDIPERDIPEMKPEPEPDPIIPTVPEIIVVPEPIPESKPEREPKVEAEELVIEEEQVVAEPVPKAKPVSTLPKTGAANPLMTSGFGAILLAAGWYLRKKED